MFLPIIFLQGLTGRLFREFGIVVSGAIVISTLVSLTLTPMLSARFLRKSRRQSALFRFTENILEGINHLYNASLKGFLKIRWLAWPLSAACIAAIYYIIQLLPTEIAPLEDKSSFRVFATAPEGTTFEVMDNYMTDLLDILDTIPEARAYISVTSPGFGSSTAANSGFVFFTVVEPDERERSQSEIVQSLYPKVRGLNYARAIITQRQTIEVGRRFRGLPVQYVIQAPDFDRLKEALPRFVEEAEKNPAFSVVDLDLKFNKPELHIEIDRERARSLGVTVRDIAETLQLFYSGQRFGYFIKNGKQYEVVGEASRQYRNDPGDLAGIYVRNRDGELIQLSNLVYFSEESNPPTLYRYNRYISATVSAGLADGYTIGDGIEAMDQVKREVLDESFSSALSGASKDFVESSGGLYFAFFLALILIYLALSAQFESFLDPLVIMFTVPLAITGALLALWMGGHTINIFSQIGVIVLIGIVTKNGILIVEFANQKMEAGLTARAAVLEAATLRLRPILMTSMATILGVLPIAMAFGSASTSRIPMGVAIIGGLIFSLFLTLYVIPSIYTYFKRKS